MRNLALLIIFLLLSPALSLAESSLPMQQFGALPIAHEGRIKPLSVFAREQLKEISGERKWHKKSAIEWLAAMLFTPEKMEKNHLIQLRSEPLREMLALPLRATHLYSLRELRNALRSHLPQVLGAVTVIKQKKPVTPLQEALAETYARVQHFQQLQDSLSFLLPFPADPATTYYALAKRNPKNIDKPVALMMARMEERGRMSTALTVIPSGWQQDTDWYSPWSLRFNGRASPQTAEYVALWKKMAMTWRGQHLAKWNQAVSTSTATVQQMGGSQFQPARLWLEEWYYRLSFLTLTIGFYITFIISAIPASRSEAETGEANAGIQQKYRWIPAFAGMTAVTLHGLALLVRMLILGRPPVSNLYESVLFVSFLIAASGAAYAWQQRKTIFAIAAGGVTALLLILSQSLLSGQEQLPVVMAVLNTDFWLATHVICITSGYAAAVLTSLMAHYALWNPQPVSRLQLLALVALLLTAVGTLLGGIWADQSWGRFWGWDPKENGALLIVLWLIWLLHGRLAGQMSDRWYLAGMAFLNAIVALAWFGVNLLSVGLHSYGFTSGTAWGLVGFLAAQTLLIAGLIWRSYRHA